MAGSQTPGGHPELGSGSNGRKSQESLDLGGALVSRQGQGMAVPPHAQVPARKRPVACDPVAPGMHSPKGAPAAAQGSPRNSAVW